MKQAPKPIDTWSPVLGMTMLNWLNTNAGAVQAVCTLVLVGVTWYYVRLTKLIAETSHRQLSATLQPILQVVKFYMAPDKTFVLGVTYYRRMSGSVTILNQGASPLKLGDMYLVAEHQEGRDEYPIDDHYGRVLMPKDEFVGDYSVLTDDDHYSPIKSIRVECTDLSEIFLHSFSYHQLHGTQHQIVLEPTAWDRVKSATQKRIKRLKRWG